MTQPTPARRAFLRPALAGAAATLSGVGLGRFAYVPLFPAMVTAGWITGAEGALLGALNLTGYLVGVLGGRPLAQRIGTAAALTAGMVAAALAFLACAHDGGATWLAAWRFVSGASGGILMALAGPAVQGAVDPRRRGIAGGLTISGVAIRVIAGAVLVPAALPLGIPAVWLGLAAAVGALALVAYPAWPRTPIVAAQAESPVSAWRLHAAYGVSGAGLVPHMVYFADLAVRGRGFDPGQAASLWLAFGIGALAGPLLAGRVADRIGAASALRIWLAIQVAAVAAAFGHATILLAASAAFGGFAALGLSAICLARAHELAGPAASSIWVRATASFAVCQAVAGFALAALFRATGSHEVVFGAGLALSVAALAIGFPRR